MVKEFEGTDVNFRTLRLGTLLASAVLKFALHYMDELKKVQNAGNLWYFFLKHGNFQIQASNQSFHKLSGFSEHD